MWDPSKNSYSFRHSLHLYKTLYFCRRSFCFILSIASTFSLGMDSMRSLNSTRRDSTFTSFWTGLRLPTSPSPMQTLYTWLIFLLRESISFSWDWEEKESRKHNITICLSNKCKVLFYYIIIKAFYATKCFFV